MENQKAFPGRVHLVRQKASPLTKIVILTALVLSITAVLCLMAGYRNQQAQAARLEQEATAIAAENQKLIQNINQLGTDESVRQIARDELGMADPGVIVFEPQQ